MLSKNYYAKNLHNSFSTKNYLFFLLILISISAFSQKKINTVTKSFVETNSYLHELQIEKFFLHTNKTVYMPGEKVWFKAYIVNDADNKPSLTTTNLHINVYDANKKIVSNHLFLVKDGTTHGDIMLDKELAAGNYFIELTTQWNQNFKNNNSITKIYVVSNLEDVSHRFENENNQDFQIEFFPESNLFLENIENSIAFTAQNSSTPITISGNIIDDKTGIIVAKINSNYFGMGKFELYNRPNRSYTAFVNYNGLQKEFPLPQTNSKGIIVKKDEEQADAKSIDLILKTNEATIKSEAGDYVFAVLHRNGRQNVIVPIKLKKRYINYSFNILKENLFDGVNTISLFNNQNEPISEFSFYHSNEKQLHLNITKIAEEQDSLTLNFDLKNKLSKANLSISILPSVTKMHHNQSNINSAFLLAPYLEDAHKNLPELISSSKSEENMNLLLMTNAKKNSLSYKKKAAYQKDYVVLAENGMSINGNVSANVSDLNGYKVMLSSLENELLLIDTIGNSNKFSFDNLFLKKPTKYKLALLDHNGAIVKTGFKLSSELISYDTPDVLNKNIEAINSKNENSRMVMDYGSLPLLEDVTLLDEITLTVHQKMQNKLTDLGLPPDILRSEFSDVYPVNENLMALTVYDFLDRLPGLTLVGDPYIGFQIYTTRGKASITGNSTATIFIDDIRMNDSEPLTSRSIDDFIAVTVNPSGAGAGIYGQGGVISFYTKTGKYGGNLARVNKDIISSETDLGFDTANKYENNLMQFSDIISRKFYGTIDWIPNFEVTPTTSNHLKFNTNGYKNFKVIVNGMNENGEFVYKEIDFKRDEN
ncbi:MAG: MG2 domain-containing protein [Urechidicola sp.]|nr:MG2 domain-containing protein [Urechidicola sp.]